MYKKQQDRKQRINPYVPQLEQRYFRRNEGTTDYATIPDVTLSGDQRWEFDVLTTEANTRLFVSGSEAGDRWYLGIQNGKLLIGNGTDRIIGADTIGDGAFHSITWEVSGGIVTAKVDGVTQYSNTLLATLPYSISNLMASEFGGTISSGTLANLKIYDNGTLVRDYPLDDNSSTIRDKANGQNGTIINGNASDWGLFDRQADGDWLGQELVVNGGFDSDSGWTLSGTSIAGGKLVFGTDTTYADQINLTTGNLYQFRFDVVDYNGASIGLSSLTVNPSYLVSAPGSYMVEDNAVNNYVRLVSTGSDLNAIDNVSVKEVLKNA